MKIAESKKFNKILNTQMGAVVEEDSSISFRVCLPKVESVFLQFRPINSKPPGDDYSCKNTKNEIVSDFFTRIYNHKSRFPKISSKILDNNWHFIFGNKENLIELNQEENNIFHINIKSGDKYLVEPNYLYRFLIKYFDNDELIPLKDPYSNFQPFDTDGWSQIIDHRNYRWDDKSFFSAIRRDSHTNLLENKIILEMHLGAFSKEGTFESAIHKIPSIADDGIFDIIEILPVADFYGKMNWGYDGVDLFAPDSEYCKHPNDFKKFVNQAHRYGLKVILDVVYNHYGPDYSISEFVKAYNSRTPSPWGNSPNLNNVMIKKFILDNLFYWIENYHIDGFRLDATYALDKNNQLKNDLFLNEITLNIKKRYPGIILIAEDIRNAPRITRKQDASMFNKSAFDDISYYYFFKRSFEKIDLTYNIGYDAQWNVDFTKSIEAFLTGYEKNYSLGLPGTFHNDINEVIRLLQTGSIRPFDFIDLTDASIDIDFKANINYISCHDSIGNYNGTRLILKILQSKLYNSGKIAIARDSLYKYFKSKSIKSKNKKYFDSLFKKLENQILAKVILFLIQDYYLLKSSKSTVCSNEWANLIFEVTVKMNSQLQTKYDLPMSKSIIQFRNLQLQEFTSILEDSIFFNKLAFVLLFISDSVKMIFMGDEEGIISPFKYFRDFPTQYLEDKIASPDDKGYDINYSAFAESKIDYENFKIPGIKDFIKSLSHLYKNNKIFNGSTIDKIILAKDLIASDSYDNYKNILLIRKKTENQYLYAILNFSLKPLVLSLKINDHPFFDKISNESRLQFTDSLVKSQFEYNANLEFININCPKYSYCIIF